VTQLHHTTPNPLQRRLNETHRWVPSLGCAAAQKLLGAHQAMFSVQSEQVEIVCLSLTRRQPWLIIQLLHCETSVSPG